MHVITIARKHPVEQLRFVIGIAIAFTGAGIWLTGMIRAIT